MRITDPEGYGGLSDGQATTFAKRLCGHTGRIYCTGPRSPVISVEQHRPLFDDRHWFTTEFEARVMCANRAGWGLWGYDETVDKCSWQVIE